MSICKWIMNVFPKLFGFEYCGVLFVDSVSNDLFKIQFQPSDEHETKARIRDFDSIVLFPMNIGSTGQAIEENRVVTFNEGDRQNSNF